MNHPKEPLTRAFCLDPIHDSRHLLRADPLARESLVFMLQFPEHDIAAFVYTWVNGESKAGAAFCVYGSAVGPKAIFEAVDGIPVPADQGFDDWKVGGVHVRHGAPLQTAHVSVAGKDASVEFSFEAMHPAYNYGAHAEGCPAWMADDRFEQSGTMRGVLRLGGRELTFESLGHRDHSWGTRDWGIAQHWKWLEAQAGPDLAVHVFEYNALGKTQLLGYVLRDGEIAEVTDATFSFEHDTKLFHTSIQADVRDSAGRSTTVSGKTFAMFEFKVNPLATLNEGSMAVQINGVQGVGHVEMCWPEPYLEYVRSKAADAT
jgi:hypothetical protein